MTGDFKQARRLISVRLLSKVFGQPPARAYRAIPLFKSISARRWTRLWYQARRTVFTILFLATARCPAFGAWPIIIRPWSLSHISLAGKTAVATQCIACPPSVPPGILLVLTRARF